MEIGVISIETLFGGLDGALERLLIARNRQNVGEIFVAVFEVLNWVYSIDDRLRKDRGERWYKKVRNGSIVRAVRFARNRVQHQWADAFIRTGGAEFPIQFPSAFHEWRWKERAELPTPPPTMPDKQGASAYDSGLAGQSVRLTIELATRVLREAQDADASNTHKSS